MVTLVHSLHEVCFGLGARDGSEGEEGEEEEERAAQLAHLESERVPATGQLLLLLHQN